MPEPHDYIRQSLAVGVPEAEIRRILLQQGWELTAVNTAFFAVGGAPTVLPGATVLPEGPARLGAGVSIGLLGGGSRPLGQSGRAYTGRRNAYSSHTRTRTMGRMDPRTSGIVCLLFAAVALVLSGVLFVQERNLAARGVVTLGRVVQIDKDTRTEEDSDGYEYTVEEYSPVWEFTDGASNVHRFEGSGRTGSSPYPVGFVASVLYDPLHPSVARLNNTDGAAMGYMGVIFAALFGVVFGIWGAVLLFVKKGSALLAR